MKYEINIDFDNVKSKLDNLNELRKEVNEFFELRKIGKDVSLSILETGEEVAMFDDTFGKLFDYRDNYKCKINFETQELEVFTCTALHTHSEYSILDGANRLKDLAKKYPYSGAITDHGVMYGFIDFYKKMTALHKKPIIGFEAYTRSIDGEETKNHLIVLAKDDIGMKNIMKLCTAGCMHLSTGKVPRPLISYEEIEKYHEGLVILSACIAGEVPRLIIKNDEKTLERVINFYKTTFGDDYYFEIQRHTSEKTVKDAMSEMHVKETFDEVMDLFYSLTKEEFVNKFGKHVYRNVELFVHEPMVNKRLIELSKKYGIKLVATTDAHYLNAKDSEMHEALLCNQTKTTLSNPDRFRFAGTGYHVHTVEEMEELFSDMPEVLTNTLEIEDKCNVEIEFGNYKMPRFEVPNGYTDEEYLEKLVWDGFNERYGENLDEFKKTLKPSEIGKAKELYKERKDRVRFELDTIFKMKYQGYFFIVWEYVHYAKSHGITMGPGRGSGAGSIVLYCLHITEQLDPIKYDLLFERFLNPDRVSMPDVDLDYEFELRENVIEHCREKYGKECVSRIITFGTMAAKGSVKDMARVLGYEPSVSDMITKLIPNEPKMTIQKALNKNPDFESLYNTDSDVHKIVNLAMKVEGLIKNVSQHACGVIISSEDISNFCPMTLSTDEETGITALTTQITMIEAEEIGLLKFDFLGLRTESVIKECLIDMEKYHGVKMENYDFPMNDVNVYKNLLAKGKTTGVFQLESSGMTSVITQMFQDVASRIATMDENEYEEFGDELFERLIAAIALYRPGPMDEIPNYIKGIIDPSTVIYDTPKAKPILGSTYGVIVYQEQVMNIVKALAGFSSGNADTIRKGMSKKREEILDEFKPYFINGSGRNIDPHTNKPYNINGCVANGISAEVAEKIWDKMESFAKYAFNKSHAAAYAVIVAQTAWLAYYYPIIFMKANINVYIGNKDKLKMYLAYCSRVGIEILPPSVNYSEEYFSLNEDATAIRFGLKGVKNLDKVSKAIMAERESRGLFTSLENFVSRMFKYQKLTKGNVEALIYVGALDEFDGTRKEKIDTLNQILSIQKSVSLVGQGSIFDLAEEFDIVDMDDLLTVQLMNTEDFEKDVRLKKENEYAGLYISGHPLEDYKLLLDCSDIIHISDLVATDEDEAIIEAKKAMNVKVGGMITDIKKKITKKGNSLYTFTFSDMTGDINTVCFQDAYSKNEAKLVEGAKVIIQGKFDVNDFGPQLIVDTITRIDDAESEIYAFRVISDDNIAVARDQYLELKKMHPNKTGNIKIEFMRNGKPQPGIDGCPKSLAFFSQLQDIFGEQSCKVIYRNVR